MFISNTPAEHATHNNTCFFTISGFLHTGIRSTHGVFFQVPVEFGFFGDARCVFLGPSFSETLLFDSDE